jgi:filamentous hemagglutinin family protein
MAASTGVPAIVAPVDPTVAPMTPAMTSASARAILNQANAAKAVSLAQQVQAAARASAAALTSGVPNGLVAGGLSPVANPLSASADATGLQTWQGAGAPSQTVSGAQTAVTVTQTDARAILSWNTFNIGANTSLTFAPVAGTTAQPGWVTLNRVVGQIDPATGLRDPGTTPAPSQILGQLNAPWTVLVLNPNGVLFGGAAQVNTYSLGATSLDVGRSLTQGDVNAPMTIAERNSQFLTYGLLGYQEQASVNDQPSAYTFSAAALSVTQDDPTLEGSIVIQAGARITSADTGYLLFAGPKVVNAGQLTSLDGEVALVAGRQVLLQASDGSTSAVDPNIRGLAISTFNRSASETDYAQNSANGLIQASDGYIALASPQTGAAINQGVLASSTSVSRNGYIQLTGLDIQLAPGSTLSITPDDTAGTIPQDTTSLSTFKSSQVDIGSALSRIEVGSGALIYAPGGNVNIGASAGSATVDSSLAPGDSRIFVDSGATIDVAGLTNVLIPASRNSIAINPVTLNELADSPNYKSSFLNGATVYVDPRLSGVDANGVAWVGSPLVEAASYAQQVGVSASELMTKGGNVVLGVASYTPTVAGQAAPDITVKPGATIDVSGGWVTYEAGLVKTTRLIDANGEVVDISNANPNDTYIGIYTGYTASQPRWGVSQSYADPVQTGDQYEAAYTEGRDAGSLTVKGSAAALDGTLYANAFAGTQQILGAQAGTAASSVYGDGRLLQAAPSQLPSGGFLDIQAIGVDTSGNPTGGANIEVTAGVVGSSTASLVYGQSVSIDASGNLVSPVRDPASFLPADRLDTLTLAAPALTGAGLSDLALQTSGKITLDPGATLTLDPSGEFDAVSGRALTIDGSITTASGRINLTTAQLGSGSVFTPDAAALGSYDVTVNGTLSTRGRWVNDYQTGGQALAGSAFLNGGSISLTAAPSVALQSATATLNGGAASVNTDISGSILVNAGALLDVSGGGYVGPTGALTLTSKGGSLSLTEATTYFQLNIDPSDPPGAIPGFRVSDIITQAGTPVVPINPDRINASVFIAPDTVLADGFAGGGTFRLTTPQFALAPAGSPQLTNPTTGTVLPLDFFNAAGFASYKITSYKTALLPNAFANGLGGYNALLQTQTVEIGAGQTLNLTQSGFSPLVDQAQIHALWALPTGGDLFGVLQPGTPTQAWYQQPVSLNLGGLIEFKVDAGASVVGAAGASLTAGQIYNEGDIRLPGGTLAQSDVLPAIYTESNALAVGALAQVFSTDASGAVQEGGANRLGIVGGAGGLLTNAQVAAQDPIYLLGDLGQSIGVQLTPGSVTDLSGAAIVNPNAKVVGQGVFTPIVDGKVVGGGTLQTASAQATGTTLFATPLGVSVYTNENPQTVLTGGIVAANGAAINVSGAAATFDRQGADGVYSPTLVWSDAGALNFSGGALLRNTVLLARGGAPGALGGTLTIPNLTLTQDDTAQAALDTLSANGLQTAGIATLVDEGQLNTLGAVDLSLARGFFLTSGQYTGLNGQTLSDVATRDSLAPTIGATGDLRVSAPYIAFDSAFQSISTPLGGTVANYTATFSAQAIDLVGAVRFDESLANVNLDASGDLRLLGASPWQQNFNIGATSVANSLVGQLSVTGNLTLTAAQVYPTTGSTYTVSSVGAGGTIAFAQSPGSSPAAPYSAGGLLLVQAANIAQSGVVRAPLGALTLGSNSPLSVSSDGGRTYVQFAPATQSLTLAASSITSVSASGLSIPYGVTTDQTEWYFSPTNSSPLTAPPAAVLSLAGQSVTIAANAKVDVSGGGDVYAYEFISGTGGSHDVLSQFNTNALTGNDGYQYPDHRQVYAIVPGLSSQTVAAYDPIYSANYSSLYSASGVGQSVYLNAGPGVAAGWYTLLPAQYAMLPGGMRVVQDTSAKTLPPVGGQVLNDGTVVVSGEFGVAGTSARGSTVLAFDVQSQSTFEKYSNIALTSGDTAFAADAAHSGVVTPRLPIDAGQLVLDPISSLNILSAIDTTPGAGGRGALVDISGSNLDIVGQASAATVAGAIVLTAGELTDLNADSLLIGGQRTENSDGTTSLDVTAHDITVENSASSPLSAPEILFAVDGRLSEIHLKTGSSITATGTADASQTGNYLIDGATPGMTGQGALLRVANGPQRLVTRQNLDAKVLPGLLVVDGGVTLGGTSVLLESSGNVRVGANAKLTATNLALGARTITFTDTAAAVGEGLTLTPALQAKLAAAANVTLTTPAPIVFAAGSYSFNNLTLDTPGLLFKASTVSPRLTSVGLTATNLSFANSAADGGACGAALACGGNQLLVDAQTITFGSGSLATYGFGGQVSLTATSGIFAEGTGSLNVGPAALDLQTPFLGDKATPATVGSTTSATASLTLTTTGAVSVTNPSGASAGTVAGTPGSSLRIDAGSIAVAGTDVRATAGTLTLQSAGGINIATGSVLETPGYSHQFGDTADPYSISAPGGLLSLTALGGDISLASGATLSVGGGAGDAGALTLVASGAVDLQGALNASAPGGQAGLTLTTGSSFDLSGFEKAWGSAFTGNQSIQSASGGLILSPGLTIKATGVSLAADGGPIDIGGAIDVSGAIGGNVTLYGAQGVSLDPGALIDAHASGYAGTDTRQATGGTVTIGVDGTGAIQIASGAVIDVAATRPGDRLVTLSRDGANDYSLVQGDQGGSVLFREPAIDAGGGESVNIVFNGAVQGATAVTVEGFQRYDLGAIAASGAYAGVSLASNQVVLDTTAVGTVATPNFLTDNAPGTLVNFIQSFDLSAARTKLGGLTSLAGFSEQPGVELDYSGAVTLASNWNLGAGTVNVAGAAAAGLMAPIGNLPGKYYVLPGDEAAVFSNYTALIYRVGGSVAGAPGVLTLRAGGNLTLNGSITDGFFTFADQTDPDYLNLTLGGGNRVYQGFLTPTCAVTGCTDVTPFSPGATPNDVVSVQFPIASGLASTFSNPIPYSAAANSPGALGTLTGASGDPIGSAQLFPLIQRGGANQVVQSWSYQLVGGASAGVDPLQTAPGGTGDVIVQGFHPYQYQATTPVSSFNPVLNLTAGAQVVSPASWLAAMLAANPSLTNSAYTLIDFSAAPASARSVLSQDAINFFSSQPSTSYVFQGLNPSRPTGVATSLLLASQFFASSSFNFGSISNSYRPPTSVAHTQTVNAIAPTLVRTGTGDISIAAAQTVDLRNGATPTYLTASGAPTTAAKGGLQVGGVAVYTAGHAVDASPIVFTASTSGDTIVADATASGDSANLLANPLALNYDYGGGTGFSSILIANPVYATGGGDVSVSAGEDVLGRRDIWLESRLGLGGGGAVFGYSWIGNGDQAWRIGAVGPATDIRIDPQLFQEGLGALGGGDITVAAGRTIGDLSMVDTTTVATAQVAAAADPAINGQALVTYGGGNVSIVAAGDLLGGRLDVGSGLAAVTVGGDIASAGQIPNIGLGGQQVADTLRLRLSDATVTLDAGGAAALQGVSALGVRGVDSDIEGNLDSMGFYSANASVSLVANGSLTIANAGVGVLTQNSTANGAVSTAVYPGSLEAVSLNGDLSIATANVFGSANAVVLYPVSTGQLTLAAAGDISASTLDMEDSDPNQLPGAFTNFRADVVSALSGHGFAFPNIQPDTNSTVLASYHDSTPIHLGDTTPNRIYAGGDITDVTLSTPKQTRIGAGLDIVNMVFVGQNLLSSDITRIVAGRDIIATTVLTQPVISATDTLGQLLPTLQGNSFTIGGPGSFFLEAGRDAGPFLNSAVTNGFVDNQGHFSAAGTLTYGGGILSVGNQDNPWLAQQGASIYTEFGVAKGAAFDALREAYLDPANLATMPDYLFVQTTNAAGISVPDRTQPIYGPILIAWIEANTTAFAPGQTVTYQQAYDVFVKLPKLQQETFLLQDVYFNELSQTSIPTSVSYHQYSRGYLAVNTLFPASDGYTKNDLAGGSNGANSTVSTGNLDLRLATIQTDQGGNIFILGPGGRVLAGSTVATATQAAQRAYEGGLLFSGNAIYAGSAVGVPLPSAISSIPVGDEGVLTLRGGGIYSFTDGAFLLNQSRLFTEAGGDIVMWSSNGDLNAGQGQKTTADVPPVVVTVDPNAYSLVNQDAAVSGAGIGAFFSDPTATPPNVYLIAPRGTVDAGAAGIRVAGNLFIAANSVANASNIQVGGTSSGISVSTGPSIGVQTGANATAAAAAQTAQGVSRGAGPAPAPSVITVIGVGAASDSLPPGVSQGGANICPPDAKPDDKTCRR